MNPPLVVVSAGTYHLPFDRLSAWIESWLQDNDGVRVVVQHGPSAPVAGAENVEILPYPALLELCREADAVVLQGGAGGVMDMRALGVVPIVVPRVPGGGEVVDDHQLVFSAEMESLGVIRRALTADALSVLLAEALAECGTKRAPREIPTPGVNATRELLEKPISALAWYRIPGRMIRSGLAIVASRLGR